tara:strand:- start:2 stop:1489 length:1488 start_codon:yes stop_codon:yes gene_type:complete
MNYAQKEIEKTHLKPKKYCWTSPLNVTYSFNLPHTVYPPREDTDLLADTLLKLGSFENRKLLEIGCGSGVISIFANKLGWEVVGCDINPLAIASSRGISKKFGIDEIEFIEGGIEPNVDNEINPFIKGPFDLIIWNLPYLEKPNKDELLGPFEEAALSDLGENKNKKLHQLLIDKIERYNALKKGGAIILIHNDSGNGRILTSECRKRGWATREINNKILENGEKLLSTAIWKPWEAGKNISLDRVDSTNSFLLEGDYPIGTSVVTKNQTKGRGQRKNKWTHFKGGWCGSWKISLEDSSPAIIQAKAALAIIDSIAAIISEPLPTFDLFSMSQFSKHNIVVKWPNDILIEYKKFSGILCEARTQGENTKCVIGIGCNLSDPEKIITSNYSEATSLISLGEINEKEWRLILNASIASKFEKHNLFNLEEKSNTIINWWQSMSNFNKKYGLLIGEKPHKVCKLNSDGSLQFISQNGKLNSIKNIHENLNYKWTRLVN